PYSKVGGRPTSNSNPSPTGKEHEMNRIRTTQGKIVLVVAPLVFTAVPGAGVMSARNAHFSTQTLSDYQQWIKTLSSQNYTVVQGNVFLMVNTECPTFVAIFDSCFGNNPAAPYIIPQPSIEHSYVAPYY